MKAAQYTVYGGPEVVQIIDAPVPSLKEGQILVENYAASINAFDYKLRSGMYEKMIPVSFPFTIGGDLAGKVIAVGEGVTDFSVGDEVYGQATALGAGSGSMAENVAVGSTHAAAKPQLVNMEEAAALPLVGASTVQALEEHIHLKGGQKILIHGGAGGIGHVAVQLAKALGAYVVATAKTEDVAFVKRLGADEVIDYKTQKFEELVKDFDAVFDTVGGDTTEKSFQVLKKGGVLVSMLGQPSKELAEKYGVTAIGQNTHTNTAVLQRVAELVDSGKIKVHIDKVFSLDQVREAFTYQEKTHPNGKVVVKIQG